MTVNEHLTEFAGYPLLEWDPKLETVDNPANVAFALRLTWEDHQDAGARAWIDRFNTLLSRPYAADIQALVVGMWGWDDMGGGDSAGINNIIQMISASREKLPNLKALFIGDITFEENEISWIVQGNMSPLWQAYPDLEHFAVRGGEQLRLGAMDMPNLKSLRIETGGLSSTIVNEVLKGKLPELEKLVLWLGSANYGADTTLDDLKPFYNAQQFPKLKYLGLCDSEITDQIAVFMATAPVLQRLEVLDLSMGTLSDEGALALLTGPYLKELKKLDLHHHFCSVAMTHKLNELEGVEVDVSNRQEDDEGWRFIAVSE